MDDTAIVSDTLEIDYEPNSMESEWVQNGGRLSVLFYGNAYEDRRVDNRTAVPFGASTSPMKSGQSFQLLRCAASHSLTDGSGIPWPSVLWVKNGEEVLNDGTKTINTTDVDSGNGITSVLTIKNFQMEDTGIYQCIFTITQLGGSKEVITSVPFRL